MTATPRRPLSLVSGRVGPGGEPPEPPDAPYRRHPAQPVRITHAWPAGSLIGGVQPGGPLHDCALRRATSGRRAGGPLVAGGSYDGRDSASAPVMAAGCVTRAGLPAMTTVWVVAPSPGACPPGRRFLAVLPASPAGGAPVSCHSALGAARGRGGGCRRCFFSRSVLPGGPGRRRS